MEAEQKNNGDLVTHDPTVTKQLMVDVFYGCLLTEE
jgi:hypothetical protein